MQKKRIGNAIETLVCTFLETQQLVCIERNFSCRLGELDLVMLETASNTLVFVEVRFRTNAMHGSATESVDRHKQIKLRRTVLHYLQKKACACTNARIDVIGVSNADSTDHSNNQSNDLPKWMSSPEVSEHNFENHLLTWTRNAIEEH